MLKKSNMNILLNYIHQIVGPLKHIKRRGLEKLRPESVYFYTFHKCASSLFSDYILKNIEGLEHVDYADQIYSGKKVEKCIFEKRGYVYGPIRLSLKPETTVYEMLVRPTSKHEFIRDKITIFFVRDPRDIMISAYYSFGFNHGLSPVREIRERQQANRKAIQRKSIDEYVLRAASVQSDYFKILYDMHKACNRSVIIKYEDMIGNFEFFLAQLRKYIDVDDNCAREIYKRSRPKKREDESSHRRSGKVGGFRKKLRKESIESINKILKDTLVRVGYES